MTWLISSALIRAMALPCSRAPVDCCLALPQLLPQPQELCPHAPIVDEAADLGDQPAQEARVVVDLQIDLLPRDLRQAPPQTLLLFGRQGRRRGYHGLDPPESFIRECHVGAQDAL